METGPREERRKGARRKGADRRTGEFDEIYKKLVSKGIVIDARKGERRKGEGRSGFPRPTNEEKYVIYRVGMSKINLERKKADLKPLPVLSLEEWAKPTDKTS